MIKACGNCDTIKGTGDLCETCNYIFERYQDKLKGDKRMGEYYLSLKKQ